MVPPDLERYPSFLPEVDALGNLTLLPVPEVKLPTVLALGHIFGVESRPVGVGGGPLTADHGVVARLVPKVVVVPHAVHTVLPAPCDVEILVEQQKSTGGVALAVAE